MPYFQVPSDLVATHTFLAHCDELSPDEADRLYAELGRLEDATPLQPPSTSRKRWPFPGFEIVYRTDTLRHSTGEPKRHRIFLLALLRAE
jgi:hypothetical protein